MKKVTLKNDTTVIEINKLVDLAIKAGEADETKWGQTGIVIMLEAEKFNELATDKKAMGKAFTRLLDKANTDDIPDEGMSRTGEVIQLRKANNKIKWSSWTKTARMVQNTSDIFTGIELLGFDTVFPDGELLSRYELLKAIKDAKPATGETPAETIIRCLDLIAKKMPVLDKKDIDSVEQRLIEVNVALAERKKAVKK